MAWIWILHHINKNFDLRINKSEFNIGRSNLADFICPSEHVSRVHATFLTTENGDLYVRDNDTVNGTFLNGAMISKKITYELHENDEVGLGVSSGLNIEYMDPSIVSCPDKDIFIVGKLFVSESVFDTKDAFIPNNLGVKPDPISPLHCNLTNHNENVDKKEIKKDADFNMFPEKKEVIDVNIESTDNVVEIKKESVNIYSIEDNFIVISDDDDDFPCSQLLDNNASNNNIQENNVIDSTFLQIKHELEELDGVPEGTVFNPITIDDDDDVENDDWFNEIFNVEMDTSNNNVLNQIRDETVVSELKTSDKPENAKKHTTDNNKYVKPPIIAPHFKTNTKSKRKPSNIDNDNNKKIKVDSNENKERQVQIKKNRKLKLKEISEKSKHKEDKEIKHNTAPAKIKISEGRGKFLLENLENCRPSLKNKETARSSCDTHKTNLPSNCLSSPTDGTKKSGIDQGQFPVAVNSNNTCVNAYDSKIASKNVIQQSSNCDDIEDILLQILHWNARWFEEYRLHHELKLPPVNKQPLLVMPKSFSNYSEYYKIVMPQMMVELWNFLYKENINTDRLECSKNIYFAKTEGQRVFKSYTEFHCSTHISKEQNINNDLLKEEDIVIMQYKFKTIDSEECKVADALGYITDIKKEYLYNFHPLNQDESNIVNKAEAILYFKVFIKSFKGKLLTNKLIKCKVVTSIVSTMRMFKALKYLENSPLSQHILNPRIDLYQLDDVPNVKLFSKDNLNDYQRKVVREAAYLCTRKEPGVYLIQGPPGTGKTRVIINIIQQILFENNGDNENNILVVAPSNGAVDEVVSRIITLRKHLEDKFRKHVKLVRLGPKRVIHSEVSSFSLHEMAKRNLNTDVINSYNFRNCIYYKEIITINEKINNIKIQNPKYNTDQTYISAKLELEATCRKILGKRYNFALKKNEKICLEGARIICTTLSSCMSLQMQEVFGRSSKKITCCIVDEATQSNELQNLIPLSLGISKIVLVGDPKQLPAVIQAKEVKDLGYGQSLFSRIMLNFIGKTYSPVNMLRLQYRMHPSISYYPNKEFYNGQLLDSYRNEKRFSNTLSPYLVFNFEMDTVHAAQYINTLEIDCLLKLLDTIMLKIGKTSCNYSVGVITPYNNQKECIINKIKERIYLPNISIYVNTVDSFQGQEKDIIIMSCVRSSSNNFLKDKQRINVALTRAKHVLYIIGCSKLFKNCEVFGKIANDAQERQLVRKLNINMDSHKLIELISK